MYYGSLEAGGTKMICAVCEENGKIIEQVSIPTLSPEETIPKIIDYFKDKDIVALGVACFGPIDLHKDSKTYGYITSTKAQVAELSSDSYFTEGFIHSHGL